MTSGKSGGSLASLRERNRQRIVDALGQLGVASRADVARRTGLSATTVSTVVAGLQDAGLVVEVDDAPTTGAASRSGRPGRSIRLARAAGVAVGIEFAEQRVRVAACDRAHQILAEGSREMADADDARQGLDAAAALVDEVLGQAGIDPDELIGVGLGLPGPIHLSSGKVGLSAILSGWVGLTVADEMSARLGVTVHVDNDANLAALAELRWGAGRDHDTLVYVKVSTGIGAGLVIGGRLFRGVGGTAGEIGHVMVDEQGPICRCGSRGCLETVVSIVRVRQQVGFVMHGDEQGSLAGAAQHPAARRVVLEAGRVLGRALADACNLLDPQRIVLGGELALAGEPLVEGVTESIRRYAQPALGRPEVVLSALGERAQVVGATRLAAARARDARWFAGTD
jgi:predicted NBD/HSP70 family sugar kinase